MALLTLCDQNRTLDDEREIHDYLLQLGIDYQRWSSTTQQIDPNDSPEKILAIYADKIEELKAIGGYVTADLIDVTPDTPGLDEMLARFVREHWHDEDEVRFIISGRGLFHIHSRGGEVVAIEVTAGDLIRVPRGTLHWFNLCDERRIRAIRLFQDQSGWTPHYSDSKVDQNYQPLCFGRARLFDDAAQKASK
jgi:1,2-dihydroxy-3-keto-5-methylthiopentene dioxygenase